MRCAGDDLKGADVCVCVRVYSFLCKRPGWTVEDDDARCAFGGVSLAN